MTISLGNTQVMRNSLAKNKVIHESIYNDYRFQFISKNEGVSKSAYFDTKGNVTVGIGFNMIRPEARSEWNEAFKGIAFTMPTNSFDQVYTMNLKLTQNQIETLFNHSASIREKELINLYSQDIWDKLKYNERLAIEDAYYNGPVLVKPGTKFFNHIQNYAATGQKSYLESAVWELEHNSNKYHDQGVQNRRNVEAEMLKTYNAPEIATSLESNIPDFTDMLDITESSDDLNLPNEIHEHKDWVVG